MSNELLMYLYGGEIVLISAAIILTIKAKKNLNSIQTKLNGMLKENG